MFWRLSLAYTLLLLASVGRVGHLDSDDVTVRRRHAEFRTEDGQHRVVDIGSLNKTYVNRRPVESAILANGDEIQIGRFRLVFLKHCPPRVDPMAP